MAYLHTFTPEVSPPLCSIARVYHLVQRIRYVCTKPKQHFSHAARGDADYLLYWPARSHYSHQTQLNSSLIESWLSNTEQTQAQYGFQPNQN